MATADWEAPVVLRTLRSLLSENGDSDAPALHLPGVAGGVSLSRGQLEALAVQLASTLLASGLRPGDVVALSDDNTAEYVVGALGVFWARCVLLPANPNYKAPEFGQTLRDGGARLLLLPARGIPEAEEAAEECGVAVLRLALRPAVKGGAAPAGGASSLRLRARASLARLSSRRSVASAPPDPGPLRLDCTSLTPGFAVADPASLAGAGLQEPQPDDLALLLHTSGSTGRPKTVPHTHATFGAGIRHSAHSVNLVPRDVSIGVTPFHHIHGLAHSLLAPLAAGGAVILPSKGKFDPGTFWPEAVRYGGTFVTTVPTILLLLLARAAEDFPAACPPPLRFLRSSSATMAPAKIASLTAAFGAPLVEAYACSEGNVLCSTSLRPGGSKPGTVGLPVAETQLAIMDADMREQPAGQAGEICVQGPSLTPGYLNNPEANADAFRGGWFHTGDLGVKDQEGCLTVLGRVKETISWGGEKISPTEVDNALLSHPDVAEAVAFPAPDELYGQVVAAAVYLSPGSATAGQGQGEQAEALRAHVAARLAPFKVPAHIFFVQQRFQRTAAGKLNRLQIAERFLPQIPALLSAAAAAAAGKDLRELLLAVWREVLALPAAWAPDDAHDFFDLGGNSLRAMQATSRLRDYSGLDLPSDLLFTRRTLGATLAELRAARLRAPAGGAPLARLRPLPGLPRAAGVPVSQQQEQQLLLFEQDPRRIDYLTAEADWLEGPLEAAALRAALAAVVARHEALRTLYRRDPDTATFLQYVLPAPPPDGLPWLELELSGLAPGEAAAAAVSAAREAVSRPIDVFSELPVRATLARLGPGRHLLVLVTHHVAFDGWSRGVLARELAAAYGAALASAAPGPPPGSPPPPALPLLPLQYADYAAWQREEVAEGAASLAADLAWWGAELAGAPPLLELPTDWPRGGGGGGVRPGAAVPLALPAQLVAALGGLARGWGTTLFPLLVAGYQLLLGRYSRQDEVVVGTPVAGRDHTALEPLIGDFVSSLPVRTSLAGDPTFRELAARVTRTLAGVRRHNGVGIQQIAGVAPKAASADVTPVYQTMIVLQDRAFWQPPDLSGLRVSRLPPEAYAAAAMFDLRLDLHEPAGEGPEEGGSTSGTGGPVGLLGTLTYDTRLFREATVARLAGHFVALLAAAAAAPDVPVPRLDMLPAEERAQLLSFSAGPRDKRLLGAGTTVVTRFEAQAAANPGAPCLEYERQALSYGQVEVRATALAARLVAAGAVPGGPVAVLLDLCLELPLALLAVLKAGGAYMPCDAAYPTGRLMHYLRQSAAAVVLTRREPLERSGLAPRLPAGVQVLDLDALDWAALEAECGPGTPAAARLPRAGPADPAYIIFTSGSTGTPKAAVVPHAAAINMANVANRDRGLGPPLPGAYLAKTSVSFDVSLLEMLPPLTAGAKLVVSRPGGLVDLPYLLGLIAAQAPTPVVLDMVPSVMSAVLRDAAAPPPPNLREVRLCGEAAEAALVERVRARFPGTAVSNLYGPCEATVYSNESIGCADYDAGGGGTAPVGPPLPNVKSYILDSALQPVPVGVLGEVYIGGVHVGLGYLNDPDRTAERFLPDPFAEAAGEPALPGGLPHRLYRTGDLGRWLPDGSMVIAGRIDQQVKLRGLRIEIGEVEAALAAIPGVELAAAAVLSDPHGQQRLVGYLQPCGATSEEGAQAAVGQQLPQYMVPSLVVQLAALPRLPNGKLDRGALPAPDWGSSAGSGGGGGGAPPATPLEEAVARIFQEVIGCAEALGAEDDFFLVGGTSLLTGLVQSRTRRELGVPDLPSWALFQNRTVRAYAALLASMCAGADAGDGGAPGAGAGALARHASAVGRWAAGHGPATRALLLAARTFKSCRLLRYLSSEDVRLRARLRGVPAPVSRLPYPAYLLLQFLLSCIAPTILPAIWFGRVLVLSLVYRATGTYAWLFLLWPCLYLATCALAAAALVALRWLLLPRRLRPGAHPLHGWLHARWAAARAVQDAVLSEIGPLVRRNAMLPWLYRLLGASLAPGVLVDSLHLYEPDLVTVGAGSKLCSGVLAAPAQVAPTGAACAGGPALLLSPVTVGARCEVGHGAVLPAGARLADDSTLRPRAAPSHHAAVKLGPCPEWPHFMAEQHMHPALGVASGLLAGLVHGLCQIPGYAAAFALTGVSLQESPFSRAHDFFRSGSADGGSCMFSWDDYVWPLVFVSFFWFLSYPIGCATQAAALWCFKRAALGPLVPGTLLTASRRRLFAFSLFLRMMEDTSYQGFRFYLQGTCLQSLWMRALGAAVDARSLLPLHCVAQDAFTAAQGACCGSSCFVYAVDAGGVVQAVEMEAGCTLGNSAVLYAGARMRAGALLGNDSVLAAHAVLGRDERLQGHVTYRIDSAPAPAPAATAAAGSGKPGGGAAGSGGGGGGRADALTAAAVASPTAHALKTAAALAALRPVGTLLPWLSALAALRSTMACGGWLALLAYVAALPAGACLLAAWLRLLPLAARMPARWREGEASVFDLSAVVSHAMIVDSGFMRLGGTPFLLAAMRVMGLQVGSGTVWSGHVPLERMHVRVGRGCSVEAQAFVEGHYLERMRFNYQPNSVADGCWVQADARVMPGVTLERRARLLPGSTVLPGEVVQAGAVWGGGMPATPLAALEEEEEGVGGSGKEAADQKV